MNSNNWFGAVLFILILIYPVRASKEEIKYIIVASINEGIPCQQTTIFIKKEDTVRFYPVIRKGNNYYSNIEVFVSDNKYCYAQPLPEKIRWYLIKPLLGEYNNLVEGFSPQYIDPIKYIRKEVKAADNDLLDKSDFIKKEAYGTYYLAIEWDAPTISANLHLHKENPGHVVQVVYRPDDSYLGYLQELFRTPFILNPRRTADRWHQVEERMGSDCASFAIYGQRRMGNNVPYCGPKRIINYLNPIVKSVFYPVEENNTLIFKNSHNQYLYIGEKGLRSGDIIYFPEQVAVFYRDEGVIGILDKDDYLIQSSEPSPCITTIEKCGYFHQPIKIFRWKEGF